LLPALGVSWLQPYKASFFLGLAVCGAVLKWLGWLLLPRPREQALAYARFPVELFTGLAALCVWFYLRNWLGEWWPATYSLRELAVLPYLAGAVHLAGLLFLGKDLVFPRAGLGRRLAMVGPFVLTLTVALWQVSGSLGVHGS